MTPSSRVAATAPRWRIERPQVAVVVPLEQRRDASAPTVDEASRRERIRVELLVARARAARSR